LEIIIILEFLDDESLKVGNRDFLMIIVQSVICKKSLLIMTQCLKME